MRKLILATITMGLVTAGTVAKSSSVEFHEGQAFPSLVFPSLRDGRPGSVADFRGKKLILHIFASW